MSALVAPVRMALAIVTLGVVLVMAACGGDSGPSVAKLEQQRNVEALLEIAGSGDSFGDERQTAVGALRRLADPALYALLAETLRTEKYPSGAYATPGEVIEVLGAVGGPEAATLILDWVRANYDPVNTLAWPEQQMTWALTAIGPDAVAPLAAILAAPLPAKGSTEESTDRQLRTLAISVLGGVDARSPFTQRTETTPRFTGALGSDPAEQALLVALTAEPRCELATATVAFSCTRWGEEAGLAMARRRTDPSVLLSLLEDPTTARIYYGLVRLGAPGTEAALVAALERNGGNTPLAQGMAQTFASSGNEALEAAASSWRSANDYTLQPRYCPPPGVCEKSTPLWGSINDEL